MKKAKKAFVIAVWSTAAVAVGMLAAQTVYMCGAPTWAVGLAFIVCAAIVFWFGTLMIAAGD